jgi:hypothetical protein
VYVISKQLIADFLVFVRMVMLRILREMWPKP